MAARPSGPVRMFWQNWEEWKFTKPTIQTDEELDPIPGWETPENNRWLEPPVIRVGEIVPEEAMEYTQ